MRTETEFYVYMKEFHRGNNPLSRTLMNNQEIRWAERLVKRGLVIKGTAIEDARVKVYYTEGR